VKKAAERNVSPRIVLLLTLAAYLVSAAARLPLAWLAEKNPSFGYGGGIIPIWTPDAGYIGAQAKRLLAGLDVPWDNEHAAGHLMAWAAEAGGWHIDTVMFYAPALLGSLIVVPVMLIMTLYRRPVAGFFAAVFAAVGFNFYFRTHLGYADTDMLNFFFVYLLLYGMIGVSERRQLRYGYIGFVAVAALGYWYHAYKPLVTGLFGIYLLYVVVADRRNTVHYYALALLGIAMLPAALWLRLLLAAGVGIARRYVSKRFPEKRTCPYLLAATVAGTAAAAVAVASTPRYYLRIVQYFDKPSFFRFEDAAGNVYRVEAALKGISEAMRIPLSEAVVYLAGNAGVLAAAFVGLALLTRRRRSALLLWAMIALGLAATVLGVRFTTFGVPAVAVGVFTAISVLTEQLRLRAGRAVAAGTAAVLIAFVFLFPLRDMAEYNRLLRPVYLSEEAGMLDRLSRQGSRNDFIVSWWDNGWPLWYATGKRTLVDNGKHNEDNFLVAKMFFTPNARLTANMASRFLEAYAEHYGRGSVLKRVARRTDLRALLKRLATEPPHSPRDFDVYFYFDDDLIPRLPLIARYASLDGSDPLEGEILSYTWLTKPFGAADRYVRGRGLVFDRKRGIVTSDDGQSGRVGLLIVSDGKQMKVQRFYAGADYNLIVYKNRYILMVSDRVLNSFVIRGLLLNGFDRRFFEPAGLSPRAKVLKLRRTPVKEKAE